MEFLDANQLQDEELSLVSKGDDESEIDVLSDREDVQEKSLSDCHQEKDYFVSEAEVRECQEDDIKNISEIFSVSKAEASILLLNCHWNVNAVPKEWFPDGQKLREELGLFKYPIVGVESSDAKVVTCGICTGTFSKELTAASLCGHIFCKTCWKGVIKASIIDGYACLMLQCPHPSCSAAVGQDMINMLASDDDKKKYEHYFLRSYVECNPMAQWCPAPGCNCAVVLVGDDCNSKVTCKCSYSFCRKCTKEYHQPISCAALRKWEMESLVQPENWTIACPKCRQSVEVDGHFKRVECASCKYHFCRLCLASWLKYGFWEGDEYTHVCSEGKLKQPVIAEGEEEWIAMDRLIGFHERQSQWKTHNMHFQAALKEIQKLQNGQLKTLADIQGRTEADMSFVREAWLQIAECWRFLKWACVYEYYLMNCEREKRNLFSYLLRSAGFVLEQLYLSASELTKFLTMDEPSAEFIDFRIHLFFKTSVAQNYFNNMMWAIKKNHSNLNALHLAMQSRDLRVYASKSGKNERSGNLNRKVPWCCVHCKFPNYGPAYMCLMCQYL